MARRKLNAQWEICPHCEGHGKVDTQGVLTEETLHDWDEEDWENYQNGMYDRSCGMCGGTGKVDTNEIDLSDVHVRYDMEGIRHTYLSADDASEHWLRMAGG
jgi:RecJ-like exonuclease